MADKGHMLAIQHQSLTIEVAEKQHLQSLGVVHRGPAPIDDSIGAHLHGGVVDGEVDGEVHGAILGRH